MEDTSYPLNLQATKSVFASLREDYKSHTPDEFISSTYLWYFGEYPYNNTELFVRLQTDIMTWGQWKNASNVLAYFYEKFSTVSLSFEVKSSVRKAQPLAQGRFSLYDRL